MRILTDSFGCSLGSLFSKFSFIPFIFFFSHFPFFEGVTLEGAERKTYLCACLCWVQKCPVFHSLSPSRYRILLEKVLPCFFLVSYVGHRTSYWPPSGTGRGFLFKKYISPHLFHVNSLPIFIFLLTGRLGGKNEGAFRSTAPAPSPFLFPLIPNWFSLPTLSQ